MCTYSIQRYKTNRVHQQKTTLFLTRNHFARSESSYISTMLNGGKTKQRSPLQELPHFFWIWTFFFSFFWTFSFLFFFWTFLSTTAQYNNINSSHDHKMCMNKATQCDEMRQLVRELQEIFRSSLKFETPTYFVSRPYL